MRPEIKPWKVLELPRRVAQSYSELRSWRKRATRNDEVEVVEVEEWTQTKLGFTVNLLLFGLGAGAAGYPLWRFAHRAAGWNATRPLRAVLEGHSTLWSSASALVALTLTVMFAIFAWYARPKSLGYFASALALFLVAFTLMFIALSSGHEADPSAPDSAPLVRWAIPIAVLGVALRVFGNGVRACGRREGARRIAGFFHGVLFTAVAFCATELLFGAGLGRLIGWLHPH
jgi:hypothetical protein